MKVLFVFHDAERTGATLNLLNIVKWLAVHTEIQMSFLIREDGPLYSEIGQYGRTSFWDFRPLASGKGLIQKVLISILNPIYRLFLMMRLWSQKFDLIYANTIGTSKQIKVLSRLKRKIIWHIHELEMALQVAGMYRLRSEKYADLIIANSPITRDNLVAHGISQKRIRIVSPVINIGEISGFRDCADLRSAYGIDPDAIIIGSSGSGIDRKGINLFLQLPGIIDHFLPGNGFYYIWVGKIFDAEIHDQELRKQELDGRMLFPGELQNPYSVYGIFDIYVSCSKEESFGLSAAEAAVLQKPVICFEKTGGLEELVHEFNNITVPYLDVIAMAEKIIELAGDASQRHSLGRMASESVKKYDIGLVMPEFARMLDLPMKRRD